MGDFAYCNPTRLHFGKNALDFLPDELTKCGKTMLLVHGGGSIKKTGLYDKVLAILRETGKTLVEDAGVMPNPTLDKLREGARLAWENNVDLILSVGGGSCCDYSKGVSAAAWCEEDPWEKFYQRHGGAEQPAHSGGLRADHGGHGLGDERRFGYHQYGHQTEGRQYLRQRALSKVRDPEPGTHLHPAARGDSAGQHGVRIAR